LNEFAPPRQLNRSVANFPLTEITMTDETTTTDPDKPELGLADTIYTTMGIPEIQVSLSLLYAINDRLLGILNEQGILNTAQLEEIITQASERLGATLRDIEANATSDKSAIAEVTARMQQAIDDRLNNMRKRLKLSA
jgi:hypothetical protein